MDIDAVFRPLAKQLVDHVFPTPIVYRQRTAATTYDPASGAVVVAETALQVKAGILSRSRSEGGDGQETDEITLWLQHAEGGLQARPQTGETLDYDGSTWRVVNVPTTYSSDMLIASKVVARRA